MSQINNNPQNGFEQDGGVQNNFGPIPPVTPDIGVFPATLAKRIASCYFDGQVASTTLSVIGVANGAQVVAGGGSVSNAAGAIPGENAALTLKGSATASLNTDASWLFGRDTGFTVNCSFTLACVRVFTARQRMNNQLARRFWVGVSTSVAGLNTTLFATDTPAAAYCAFRFSTAAGDTTWKAICGLDATHQTIVDTGVAQKAQASGATRFDIVPNGGTSIQFFIDGVLVATITTNIPAINTGVEMFGTGDNVNTGSAQPIIDFCHAFASFN